MRRATGRERDKEWLIMKISQFWYKMRDRSHSPSLHYLLYAKRGRGSFATQLVKDLQLLLLHCREFHPWPRNFHMFQMQPKKKKKFKSLKTKIWRNFPLVAEVTVSRRKTMVRTYFCREEICTSSRNWKGSSSSVRWKCCCLSSGNQSKMLGFLRSQPSLRDLRYQKS